MAQDPVKLAFETYYAPMISQMVIEEGADLAGKIFHMTFRPPIDKITLFEGPFELSQTELNFLSQNLGLAANTLTEKLNLARSTGHIFVYVDYAYQRGFFTWKPFFTD